MRKVSYSLFFENGALEIVYEVEIGVLWCTLDHFLDVTEYSLVNL